MRLRLTAAASASTTIHDRLRGARFGLGLGPERHARGSVATTALATAQMKVLPEASASGTAERPVPREADEQAGALTNCRSPGMHIAPKSPSRRRRAYRAPGSGRALAVHRQVAGCQAEGAQRPRNARRQFEADRGCKSRHPVYLGDSINGVQPRVEGSGSTRPRRLRERRRAEDRCQRRAESHAATSARRRFPT